MTCKRSERKDAGFGAEVKCIISLLQDDRPEEDTEADGTFRGYLKLELGEENHHCLRVHTRPVSTA